MQNSCAASPKQLPQPLRAFGLLSDVDDDDDAVDYYDRKVIFGTKHDDEAISILHMLR